ncbi:MAG: sigma-70 family RNA polymerase sigma factor [Verrucomicrobiota bacterium]
MTSDLDLLRRFALENSQDAFSEIVRRHLNLVYSAALRQVRSPQLAEEVAQSVFADLARVAGEISGTGVPPVRSLTPWLYAVTRRTAIDAIRKESRRQLREQIAVEMTNMNATADSGTGISPVWTDIEQHLDDAMAALDETDRSAILLRFFENKNLREVGAALGTSDDAAQKRVSRAVERLREFFSKRNVTIGASGLAVLISANAVQSAPIGLAATISAAAVLTATAVHTSTVITATKAIAMTTLQKTLVTATVAVLAGAGIYQAHQAARLRDQIQTLQQQQAPLAEQIQQLQREHDDATNRLADLAVENFRLKSNPNEFELLRLRG